MMKFAGRNDAEPSRQFSDELHDGYMRAVLRSNSWLVIFQITDVLAMTARFNTPGSVADSNWSYRLPYTVAELDRNTETRQKAERYSRHAVESGRGA
jgi:4-alpha-glucanotransferase